MYFAYFQDLSIKVPTNSENYIKPVEACGNYKPKCPDISENTVLLNEKYKKMILYHAF